MSANEGVHDFNAVRSGDRAESGGAWIDGLGEAFGVVGSGEGIWKAGERVGDEDVRNFG